MSFKRFAVCAIIFLTGVSGVYAEDNRQDHIVYEFYKKYQEALKQKESSIEFFKTHMADKYILNSFDSAGKLPSFKAGRERLLAGTEYGYSQLGMQIENVKMQVMDVKYHAESDYYTAQVDIENIFSISSSPDGQRKKVIEKAICEDLLALDNQGGLRLQQSDCDIKGSLHLR